MGAVRIVGIPMDLGQSRRGVDMGPSAVRYAGLGDRLTHLGYEVHDCGNVPVPVVEAVEEMEAQGGPNGTDHSNARHLGEIVKVCQSTYDLVADCIGHEDVAIFLGGDHSMSVGSVSSMTRRGKIGVVWVDAHADYNTPETTPSGNVHGMPVAALLGEGPYELTNIGHPGPQLQPAQVAMIGLRSLDRDERRKLASRGMSIFTMSDIDEHGIAATARKVLAALDAYDVLHISLDMDSLDPEIAPGVGTPVPGGLTYREAHLLMEIFAASGKVRSMDIVEINPMLDTRNQTANLAVGLAASLLGQRIL
jgi:arginase